MIGRSPPCAGCANRAAAWRYRWVRTGSRCGSRGISVIRTAGVRCASKAWRLWTSSPRPGDSLPPSSAKAMAASSQPPGGSSILYGPGAASYPRNLRSPEPGDLPRGGRGAPGDQVLHEAVCQRLRHAKLHGGRISVQCRPDHGGHPHAGSGHPPRYPQHPFPNGLGRQPPGFQ